MERRRKVARGSAKWMTARLASSKLVGMDALRAHDREQALRLPPAEKLVQALEVMRVGIRLKRSTLQRQFPEADEAELDRRLAEWLKSDG
jgi:hypothetical protein